MLDFKNLFGKKTVDPNAPISHQAPGGIAGAVSKLFDKNEKEVAKLRPTIDRIRELGEELKSLPDEEIKARSQALRERFKTDVTQRLGEFKDGEGNAYGWQELGTELSWSDDYARLRLETEKQVLNELLPEAFALVREAGERTIGLRHYDVQLIGGAVLHSGRIAEMKTGEGKTLVATSPVYLNALSGRGVHLITVNDYLAERDANWMRPVYEFLGLTVAFLFNDMDNEARKAAYQCDVLYATNSEVGFDYLRDNMARSPEDMVQRALNYAVVDEVDNILIDEARTPLIISAQVAKTDRALRRQAMAKTCDKLAQQLMPSVVDREIDALLDTHTHKGRVSIDGLMEDIIGRGAFTEATSYLVDAYLSAENSARVENAAHLLDVANELSQHALIDESGRSRLEKLALEAADVEKVRDAWTAEVSHLTEPLARAWSVGQSSDWDVDAVARELSLPVGERAAIAEYEGSGREIIARVVGDEAQHRGFVNDGDVLAKALLEESEDVAGQVLDVCLNGPGALHEADAMLGEGLPEEEKLSAGEVGATELRTLIGAMEQIALRGLLPFDVLERLWQTVTLPQGADKLRKVIAQTIIENPGANAREISLRCQSYEAERQKFLQTQAGILRGALDGYPSVAGKAETGESALTLRRSLQSEITKSGPFAQSMKAVRDWRQDNERAHHRVAETLAEEMGQWVETPPNARKQLAALTLEGGSSQQMLERVLVAVRDLPGENTELPALVGEATRQIEEWRHQSAQELTERISSHIELPADAQLQLQEAIENGEYPDTFDQFAGEVLLSSPTVAPLADAVDEYGVRLEEFKSAQNQSLLEFIASTCDLTTDAVDMIGEVLNSPIKGALDEAVFGELARDTVSRHLEPLLTAENADAFAEEVKRRIPLAKEVQNKLRAADFAGRSGDALRRSMVRLVERSLEIMPFEDYKRVVRNLGWLTEKDEKRRQSALTDMGTLIAERAAGTPAFTDPENFLDTLIAGEILTDDEAAIVQRAQTEAPDETLTQTIDRVLRLPAERRRRLAEAKLQEVQNVLDQAIRAHALFSREVHYVIDLNPETGKREIVIVDESTGRKMPGRRFSEGLHEALEAKQGLEVQLESQTVASITIQNYFRLYNKLSGMTGTAKTEEQEFAKTYGMEVVSIPTNRPIQRQDFPDVVYKTKEAKMRAATFEILEHHCVDQPVLVGTRSVEVSERTSERLKAQPLQALVLAHLAKTVIWESKEMSEEQKLQFLTALRVPLVMPPVEDAQELKKQGLRAEPLPLSQIKQIVKSVGVDPDPLAEANIDKLMSLFSVNNANRDRLTLALKNGLAHSVLNAKNHRNEARIIAEAARPGAVTIATNMAGRGVDIMLGGVLDVESRWRVMTMQALARHLENRSLHVRSRNAASTEKFVTRLAPQSLQALAWATLIGEKLEALEKSGVLIGQGAKEMRDTLGQEITIADLQQKVRSRARRLKIDKQLPLDLSYNDPQVLAALQNRIATLGYQKPEISALQSALENGVPSQAAGRDPLESMILGALSVPLSIAQQGAQKLVQVLADVPDLDRALLQACIDSGSDELDVTQIAPVVGDVTDEWCATRLHDWDVTNRDEARQILEQLPEEQIEINEAQIARLLGEQNLGGGWVRERLNSWEICSIPRSFEASEEIAQLLGDNVVVHYRLDTQAAQVLAERFENDQMAQLETTEIDAPNVILLNDLVQQIGGQPDWLSPEWLHGQLLGMNLVTGDNDVFQGQMMAQAQDENGQVQEMPIDVMIYRITLARLLAALDSTLREAVVRVGDDAVKVLDYVREHGAWANELVTRDYIAARLPMLGDIPITQNQNNAVNIETGVAGQSADLVLDDEPRPEEIAHTSEQEEVLALGGLHILGTERHESRRIDHQLRGRAGRQGDPGSSRFYVSLEDELWRLFGVRGQWLLNKWDEDEPVEAGMISKSIERAQKKVELNHFEGRKHVLQYDDVMNVQREVIYRERRRALLGGDLHETVLDMAQQAAIGEAEKHCPGGVRPEEWDVHKLMLGLSRIFGAHRIGKHLNVEELEGLRSREEMDDHLKEVMAEIYAEREHEMGAEYLRGLERWLVTRTIDEYWMEHLAEMDYLREAIWQEGYAQKEPIGVYRQEGFALFQKMLGEIRREVSEGIFSQQNEPQTMESLQLSGVDLSGLDLSELQEGRLVEALSMDDDGMDDGALLAKDADGENEDQVIVRQSSHAPAMAGSSEVENSNRAARRDKKNR